MKILSVASKGLLAGLALPLLTGCSDPVSPPDEPWQAVQLDARFVHGYTGFGFEVFRALIDASPDTNLVFSPTSAAFALAMTYNGAAGETAQAMARVLGVDGMSRDAVNQNNLRWFESLASPGRAVELSLANSLWIRLGYPVVPAFLERNRRYYKAEVRELDFRAPDAVETINRWVDQSTRGKIDRIIDQVPVNVVMYLINALYFKADWTHAFDPQLTRDAPFHLPNGGQKIVPMMRQERELPVFRGPGFSMVSLPYGNGRFSMLLVLPDEHSGLREFYERLDPASWEGWVAQLQESRVAVSLPRFEIEWEEQLNEVLMRLGMGIAFSAASDFTDLSPADPWIEEVRQKTYLEVNEEGTTAAAVTVVVMTRGATSELRFDRPFFLAIRDNATGTLLFVAQVADPN